MALIRNSRNAARSGQAHFVPGGLACAAAARHLVLSRTPIQLSLTLKRAPSFASATVTRLALQPS